MVVRESATGVGLQGRRADRAPTGGLGRDPHVVGASVPGPLHLRDGLPCQDRFAALHVAPGHLRLAMADGLGSAQHSHLGAWLAVTAATDGVDGDMMRAAAAALDGRRDLACTLIAVDVRPDGVMCAHVGDGAVVAETPDGYVLVSGPGDSEYANEVDPITADGWELTVRPAFFAGATALAVFTDGLQRAALRFGQPHAGFFDPLFAWARGGGSPGELERFLSGPKVSEHSKDDKTLVLVT